MKQVVEELRTGKVRVAETPAPRCSADQLLIQTAHSLISVGTERMAALVKPGGIVADVKACLDAEALGAGGLKVWRL